MNIIVCLDDNQGMLFNKRRQSRDIKVLEDIENMKENIWTNQYSETLFDKTKIQYKVDEEFLVNAPAEAFCFVENEHLLPHQDKIKTIVVYKWNRKYPSDFKLDIDLANWKLTETKEFVGNSHEKITREFYEKG